MKPELLEAQRVLGLMNLVAGVCRDGRTLHIDTRFTPAWLHGLARAAPGNALDLPAVFPGLRPFLPRARRHWALLASGLLASEPWKQTLYDGSARSFQAFAGLDHEIPMLVLGPVFQPSAGTSPAMPKTGAEGQSAGFQQALRASEARQKAILSAIDETVLWVGENNHISTHNRQDLPPGPLPLTAFFSGNSAGEIASRVDRVREGKVAAPVVFRQDTGGSEVRYEARATLVHGAEVMVVVREIPDETGRVNKRDEVLSIANHELRTPLTGIAGALDLLKVQCGQELSAEAMEWVELARKSSKRMLTLLDRLLEVSRIESGRFPFRRKSLDLTVFMERLVRDYGASEPSDAPGVLFRAIAGSLPVMADPDALRQVFEQLLSNAARYSPAGRSFEVTLQQKDAMARVSVRDFGPGIDPKYHDRIFKKFAHIPQPKEKGKEKRLGLGLSLAKAIVDQHRGRLSFQSKVGAGTEFHLELPLMRAESG